MQEIRVCKGNMYPNIIEARTIILPNDEDQEINHLVNVFQTFSIMNQEYILLKC